MCQTLVKLQLLAKPMNGVEVAREVLSVLSIELGIQSSDLLAGIRDRASVNNVAMRLISVMYPTVLDVGCFSLLCGKGALSLMWKGSILENDCKVCY